MSCEYCGEDEHYSCDSCGATGGGRICPACGSFVCELEAKEIGDAREARGLPRIPETVDQVWS